MNHLDPPNLTTYNRGCKTTIFNSTVLSPVKSSSIEDGVWTHCLFQRLCVTHLWILGVTVASDFSVTHHVQELTMKSAQTLYALRVLQAHGLNEAALQEVWGRMLLLDWSMRQVRGTDSARPPTVNELTLCSHEQSAAATVRLIRLHLNSYAKLQTSNCLTKLNLIPIMFSTLYYHRHL